MRVIATLTSLAAASRAMSCPAVPAGGQPEKAGPNAVSLLLVALALAAGGAPAAAQAPRVPTPVPNLPNLKPLVLVNISLDGVARGLASFTEITPRPPEFIVPRGAAKTFEVRTQDGRGTVGFSHTLPAGVPASAFEWTQAAAPAPGAVGRLRYNGCTSCQVPFTITIRAADVATTRSAQVRITATASVGVPRIVDVRRVSGTEVEPSFAISFDAGTFDPSDSSAAVTYADGLRYRLIVTPSGQAVVNAVIPRLRASRDVTVVLSNPYGSSGGRGVRLPSQLIEGIDNRSFEQVNSSIVSGDARIGDGYSVKHSNSGVTEISGSDRITIRPLQSGNTPCGQHDFIYTGAAASWLDAAGLRPVTTEGSVTIASQPPVNALLRAPQNTLTTSWRLPGLKVDRWYQVVFKGVEVVGVCADRVLR